ncbi:unnamed protein product [Amoebophrya sp. A120]|nr:unnamed protein product [Amoebophrya sp. A120]|eukprot:GSA120T00005707001.1
MSRPPAKLGGSAPPPGMGFPDPHTTKNNRPAPKIEEALAKSTGAANGFDAQLDLAMRQNTPDSLSFAWRLVHWMLSRNLPPTGLILSLLLKKTAGCNWVELLYDATTLLRTKYLPLRPADLDEVVLNAILDAYSRLSQRMTSPGDGETALGHMELLFQDMKEGKFGVLPGVVSYGIVIKALGATKQLERVLALWDELRSERQLQPSVVTYGCVLDALAKAATPQSMRIAEQIFDEMSVAQKNTESMSKNCVLYSTMIKGFARLSDLEKCKQLYEKMVKRDHITPNVVCMNLLLQVAVAHRNLQLAEHYFSAMRNFGFYPDFSSYLTLLRGYLFCGSASGGSTSFIAGAATSNDVLPSSDREVVRALELLKDGLQFAKLSVEAGVLLKLIKLLLDCKRTDEVRDVLKLWAQGNVCKVSVPPAAGKLIFTHVLTNAAPLVACTVRSTLKSLQILSEVQLADVERSFYKTPDPEMWTALLAEHGAAELQVYDLVSPMTCTSAAAFSCTATPMSCLTQTSAAGKGGGGRKKGGKREFFPNAGAPLRFGSVIGREPPSVAPPFDGDVTSKSCSEVSAYYASSKGGKRGKSSKGKKGKSCLPVLSKEEAIRLMTVFPGGTSSGQHRLGAGPSAAEGCSEVDGFHFSDSACSTSRTASAGNFCLSHTVSLTDELRDATAGESMVPPKIALPPPELPPVMGHLQAKTTIKNTHCNIRVDKGNNGFVDTSAKNDNTADICVAGDSGFHADGGNNSYRGRSRSNSMEGDLFFSTSLVGENESFHEAEDEEIPFAECETEELQGLYQVPYGGDLLDELYSPTEVVTSATNKGAATFLPATSNDGSANEDLGNIAEEAGAGCGTTTVRRIREDEEHDVSAGRPTASFSVATGLLPSPLDPPSDYRGFYNGGLKNENRGVPRPRPTPLALEFSEEKVPKTAEKEHNKSAAEETETPEKFWQQVRAEQLQLEKQNAGDSGSTVLQQKENKTLAGNNESKSTVAVAEETVPGTPPPSNSSERRRSQDSLNANAVPFVPQHSPLRVPVPKRPTKVLRWRSSRQRRSRRCSRPRNCWRRRRSTTLT